MNTNNQIVEPDIFYNWIGDGKRCVAIHEAGHAIAAWLIRVDMQVIAVMDEFGYVAGEHVHEAKCLGVVKHSIIHSHDLGRLRESKSGVVGRDGKVIPFIHYYADGITRDAKRAAFVALAGPICEALYENDDVFNKKYSRPHRYDMANVNDMLDLICATDDRINRTLMLSKLVEKTKSLMTQYWPEVEKIAHSLERDSVVNGRNVNSIIGVNFVDRATPFLLVE
ncbi:peptidase M41 family protein [Salmonella enterica]|nr:peptidase M41 family protein [Salmonella enterica]EIV4497432.1 peptidase M41 family protein [Salmonella enterica]